MLWPLHYAFLGIWPTCGADGNAYGPNSVAGRKGGKLLSDGLRLVIHALKGDLDDLAKEWGAKELQQQVAMSVVPMWLHPSLPNTRYTYFGPDAVWKVHNPVHIGMENKLQLVLPHI